MSKSPRRFGSDVSSGGRAKAGWQSQHACPEALSYIAGCIQRSVIHH